MYVHITYTHILFTEQAISEPPLMTRVQVLSPTKILRTWQSVAVAHTYNASTWEAEEEDHAGSRWIMPVWGSPRLHSMLYNSKNYKVRPCLKRAKGERGEGSICLLCLRP